MRIRRLLATAATLGWVALAGAQIAPRQHPSMAQTLQSAPLPVSPYELVGGNVQTLTAPADRAAALALLDRARTHFTLLSATTEPFQLDVSLEAAGTPPGEGLGTMRQVWLGGGAWMWSAELGGVTTDRYASRGLYSSNPQAPVPIRIQMAREALFWPVSYATDARLSIRTAQVIWRRAPATCVLLAAPAYAGPSDGRGWMEAEYCVDPATGLLQTASEAPGYYEIYDYQDAVTFSGHILARNITIVGGGQTLLRVHLESVTDASGMDRASIQPTPEMRALGPSFELMFPGRTLGTMSSPASGPDPQVALLHYIVDREGLPHDAEVFAADPAVAQVALAQLVRSHFPGGPRLAQREVFGVFYLGPRPAR